MYIKGRREVWTMSYGDIGKNPSLATPSAHSSQSQARPQTLKTCWCCHAWILLGWIREYAVWIGVSVVHCNHLHDMARWHCVIVGEVSLFRSMLSVIITMQSHCSMIAGSALHHLSMHNRSESFSNLITKSLTGYQY